MQNLEKKLWSFDDLRKLGVSLTSFLYKGKEVNKDVLLTEEEESLNFLAKELLKVDVEILCSIIRTSGEDPNKHYKSCKGEKTKREKGKNINRLFIEYLNDKYVEYWGEVIEDDFIIDRKRNKNAKRQRIEETKENIREIKMKQLETMKKQVSKLLKQIEEIERELNL